MGALGSGVLTGKYNKDASAEGRATLWGSISDKNLRIAQAVSEIAEQIGRSPAQVALNSVRQQPGVMLPIIGAKKAAQVRDNLACLDFTLSGEQLARLDEVSRIELGFPYDFLTSEGVRDLVFGGTFAQIDNHRN